MKNRTICLLLTISAFASCPEICAAANDSPAANDLQQHVDARVANTSTNPPSSRRSVESQTRQQSSIASPTSNIRISVDRTSEPRALSQDKLRVMAKRLVAGFSGAAALALAIVLLGKRQATTFGFDQSAPLQLLSTLKIAPRCCLTLVQANDHYFLIARDAAGVKKIVPVPRSFDSFVNDEFDEGQPLLHKSKATGS